VKSQNVKPLTQLVGKALVVPYKHQKFMTSSNIPLQAPVVHHKVNSPLQAPVVHHKVNSPLQAQVFLTNLNNPLQALVVHHQF